MVPIKGFPGYEICPFSMRIFTRKSGVSTPLLPTSKRKQTPTYVLFKNGVESFIPLWKIILDNLEEIGDFLRKNS